MSQPPAASPPPPSEEWTPPTPTEGPLAGSAGASPVLTPVTVAQPSSGRRWVPIVVGLVLLAILGAAAKFTLLKSEEAPGKAEIDDAFTSVSGFTYAELPADAVEQAKSFLDSNPEASEAIGDFDIRQVNKGGTPVGAVIIFGVDPDVMGDAFREGFASGFQSTAGDVDLKETTIDGTPVISVTMPIGGAGTMFFDEEDGLIFFVQGNDQSVADELTGGLIQGNL